jgi:hypothetical protein
MCYQIHSKLLSKSTWNNHFKQLSWRVDVKTASKYVAESNDPVAMFELNTESGVKCTNNNTVTRFEMNRNQVADIIQILETIERAIDAASV